MKRPAAKNVLNGRHYIETPLSQSLINQNFVYGMGIQITCSDLTERDNFMTAPVRSFDFYVMSHIFSGTGKLYLVDEKKEFICPQGTVIIISPGIKHIFGNTSENPYGEDYIKFYGKEIDYLQSCGIIKTGVYYIGMDRFLQKISEILIQKTPENHYLGQIELQKHLLNIYSSNIKKIEKSYLQNLLCEIEQSPEHWWRIEEMTSFCKCSLPVLRKHFLAETGMLPKAYAEHIKLKSAAEHLQNSNETIESISQLLGYRDRFHFSRRFKLYSGYSPGEYRNKVQKNTHNDISESETV